MEHKEISNSFGEIAIIYKTKYCNIFENTYQNQSWCKIIQKAFHWYRNGKWLQLHLNPQPLSSETNIQPFSQTGQMTELRCE